MGKGMTRLEEEMAKARDELERESASRQEGLGKVAAEGEETASPKPPRRWMVVASVAVVVTAALVAVVLLNDIGQSGSPWEDERERVIADLLVETPYNASVNVGIPESEIFDVAFSGCEGFGVDEQSRNDVQSYWGDDFIDYRECSVAFSFVSPSGDGVCSESMIYSVYCLNPEEWDPLGACQHVELTTDEINLSRCY